MKSCTFCSEEKPLSDFYRNRTKPGGYDSMCKICKNHRRGFQKGTYKICANCSKEFFAHEQDMVVCSRHCAGSLTPRLVGKDNANWKGGIIQSSKGYYYIRIPEHPRATNNGYVKQADLVLEEKLGRPLEPNEIAHHIDRDKTNDSPDNLELETLSSHSKRHSAEDRPPKPKPKSNPRKVVNWPSNKELQAMVSKTSLRLVAKELGCSHVAVWKRLQKPL